VDLSLLVRFLKTNDLNAKNGQTAPGGSVCPYPVEQPVACGLDPTFPFQSPPLGYTNTKSCKLDGNDHLASGNCFAAAKGALTMNLAALGAVPLQTARTSTAGGSCSSSAPRPPPSPQASRRLPHASWRQSRHSRGR